MKILGVALAIAASFNLAHAAPGEQTSYEYDALGRLVSVTTCESSSNVAVQIEYDAAGNRSRYSSTGGPAGGGVTLFNRQNATVSQLGSGSWRIQKVGGTAGSFDASVESTAPVSTTAMISGRAVSGSPNGLIGLSTNPSASSSYENLNYSVQIYSDGAGYIYEGGVYALSFPVDQKVWVWRVGSTVKYGTGPNFATASTTGLKRSITGAPATLYFDSSIASMTDFEVAFAENQSGCDGMNVVNHANTAVTRLSPNSWRIQKVGGTAGSLDASAESTTPVSANVKISGWSVSGSPNGLIGLSADPSVGSSYENLDYSVQIYSGGAGYIYESGVHALTFALDQKVWIWREGSTVKYGTGPNFATASTTGLKRSVSGAPATLYFDSSIASMSDFEIEIQQ